MKRVWGYDDFLPLQAEAVQAVLDGRDSLVVLPTGGGKSLCYQAPAVARGALALVVSPLIALMKDQVDGLRAAGVSAAYLNSSQNAGERAKVERDLDAGRVGLLYVAPERVVVPGFLARVARAGAAFVAVDEAHCISQWGHDFRPEYRQLRHLREALRGVPMHAYTATATPAVRTDIVSELALQNVTALVGSFDRPNLIYRVVPRGDRLAQVLAAIERHRGQAGIVYCIRRAEVDELTAALSARGLRAVRYHAGLGDDERRANQEAFVAERTDVVVATVAFGMGIDRSNVRYVVHAGMPKSIEHYQQEAGRAGRDGLPAECLLLWSAADYGLWKSVLGAGGAPPPPGALGKLGEIYRFCQDATCRHRALVTYFGQPFPARACGACDVCLGETVEAQAPPDVTTAILSAVAELRGRFGAVHVAELLTGAATARLAALGHDRLGAYGRLKGARRDHVRAWIDQLTVRGHLTRAEGEYPTIALTKTGAAVLRGEVATEPLTTTAAPTRAPRPSASEPGSPVGGVDRELFEALRALRRVMADERGVPPYVIFSDASLHDMVRRRPTSHAAFRAVKGVGEWKCEAFGDRFLIVIANATAGTEKAST